MGRDYKNKMWLAAAGRFEEGAEILSEITNVTMTYLTGERDGTDELPGLFVKVMDIMADAFVLFME